MTHGSYFHINFLKYILYFYDMSFTYEHLTPLLMIDL